MSPETSDVVRRCRLALPRVAVAAALLGAALLGAAPGAAIVGGTADAPSLARSSVMVLSSRGGVCTAIVLAPDVVLTAAHCVTGGAEHRIHYRQADGAPALVAPAEIRRHPGFSPGAETTRRRSIDLALLRAPGPLPFAFSAATLSAGGVSRGARVTVGGYGVSREGDGKSSGTFRSATLASVEPYGPSRILLWASAPAGEAGACLGDSGGPIAAEDGAVAAVTSWAKGPGAKRCGALTQGILVAPQRAWIETTLSHWGRTASWK